MENNVSRIYSLIDPVTLRIRYCGVTKLLLRDRLRFHISNTTTTGKRKSACSDWIDGLIETGRIPIIELLAECAHDQAVTTEVAWIAKLRIEYNDLLNRSDGGPGSAGKRSAEHCALMSVVAKASWANATPEKREARVKATGNGLRALGAETKAENARLAALAGIENRILNPEADNSHRSALSEAGKLAWADPEIRARRLAARATPQAKANQSAAQKARWADPQMRSLIMTTLFSSTVRKQRGASTRATVLANRKLANVEP